MAPRGHESGTMIRDPSPEREAAEVERWRSTREASEPASDAPTPAPDVDADVETPVDVDQEEEQPRTSTPTNARPDVAVITNEPSQPSSSRGVPGSAGIDGNAGKMGLGKRMNQLSINTDDEDVQIAIAALGSMRQREGGASNLHKRRQHPADDDMMEPHAGASSAVRSSNGSSFLERGTTIAANRSYDATSVGSSSTSASGTLDAFSSSRSEGGRGLQTATAYTTDSGYAGGSGSQYHHKLAGSGPAALRGAASASLAGSDSAFSSTASAIVHDEDGNPVRIALDSEALLDSSSVDEEQEAFLQRFGRLPIVRGTLRAYELGKQKSRVVKYGAEYIESGVKSISRPVISRVGDALGEQGVQQLDGFACRQLDRIYPAPLSPTSAAALAAQRFSPTKEEKVEMLAEIEERERTEWQHMDEEEKVKRRRAYWALKLEEKEREMVVKTLREKQERDATLQEQAQYLQQAQMTAGFERERERMALSRRSRGTDTGAADSNPNAQLRAHDVRSSASGSASHSDEDRRNYSDHSSPQMHSRHSSDNLVARAQTQRSGWSGMLVEAGVTAGGLSAAMSEESLKSLKYCLQWLQYATAHIEHHITQLRDLIVKLNHGELDVAATLAGQNLAQIKGDVVHTIRGVVDVVGKYAGAALPVAARAKVREFMLSLPARWATVNRTAAAAASSPGAFGGSPASPSFSPLHATASSPSSVLSEGRRGTLVRNPQAAHTAAAANKVLTLAVESLDILRSVTIVFGESLDRADLWMERLRYLGLQRKRQHDATVGRIEMGMTGDWERAGAVQERAGSPDAFSDVSMTSGGSSKRRKTRTDRRQHRTPDSASEDGGYAETERQDSSSGYYSSAQMSRSNSEAAGFGTSFVPGSSAGAPVAGTSTAHSYGPQSSAQRRKNRGKTAVRSRPPSMPGTPNFASTNLHPN